MSDTTSPNNDRRDFLKVSAIAGTAALSTGLASRVFAAADDTLRVGLIGCGGRGTGAAENCVKSSPNVKIVAMGDVFENRLNGSKTELAKRIGKSLDVEGRTFVGLDAFEKVLASDIDMVILATPPGFRPQHLTAAVAADKHIFTEKPVAVDGPGIRQVLEAAEAAKKKKLAIVAGTQRRHQKPYIETIQKIHDGAIGKITGARAYWNGGGIWYRKREEGMSDAEYQIHNWYHFNWVCGDHIVEQHIHNLDVINWVMGTHPVKARGLGGRSNLGGRSSRFEGDPAIVGNIFDHFAVEFEYPDGVVLHSQCRHIPGCWNRVGEDVVGSEGVAVVDGFRINGKPASSGGGQNAYVQEHTDLIESIRKGEPLNELQQVAESTMTAILGREATYAGEEVTYEKALNSSKSSFPENLSLEMDLAVAAAPRPDKYRV